MKTLSQVVRDYGNRVRSQMDPIASNEADELLSDIVRGTPVDLGALRAAWEGPTRVGEAHYRVSNPMVYAGVVEYGGYPGVGPKTELVGAHVLPGGIAVGGGIYPSQRPPAPVRQAMSRRILPLKDAVIQVLRSLA